MGLIELSYNVHGWRQGSVWLIQGLLGEELDHRDNYTPLPEMFFWIGLNAEMKSKQSFCPWTFRREKTVPLGCSYSSTTLNRLQEIWRRQDLEKSLESAFIGIKKINEAGGWFPSPLDSKAHGSTQHALASQVASLPPTSVSWMFGVPDVFSLYPNLSCSSGHPCCKDHSYEAYLMVSLSLPAREFWNGGFLYFLTVKIFLKRKGGGKNPKVVFFEKWSFIFYHLIVKMRQPSTQNDFTLCNCHI